MTRFKRSIATLAATSVLMASAWSSVQAATISTQDIAAAQAAETGTLDATTARAHIDATLARADLQTALQERGVDINQVRARVAAMTDSEAQQLAAQIDQAPAGAADILGTLVFIFVLLLVTDILGLTKVFPFTRSIRH
ncbi:MAG: PA2779 family protein [Burkholderiales bacterium]|nr:PA2779 family protein [Burkholderiales bacterium]